MIFILLLTVLSLTQATRLPSDMIEMMDPSINPCDNFYQYSCGGWMKTNAAKSSYSTFESIREKNQNVLETLMNSNLPIINDFYYSCMNVNQTMGNQPLQDDFNRILKATSRSDLFTLAGEFSLVQTPVFLSYDVTSYQDGMSTNTLTITVADPLLSNKYYSDKTFSTIEKSYREYITNLVQLSGFLYTPSERMISDIVIDIDKQLAQLTNQETRMSLNHSLQDAVNMWPTTLGSYLNGLDVHHLSTITNQTKLNLDTMMDGLESILNQFSIEELRVYIAFRMMNTRAKWLGSEFIELRYNFWGNIIHKQSERPNRSSVCINYVLDYFPDLIGQYFYQQVFDLERENIAFTMFQSIQNAMYQHLSDASWLTFDTKQEAKVKLSKLLANLGQSKHPRPYITVVDRYHFYTNMQQVMLFESKQLLFQIGHSLDRHEWSRPPTEVNALYGKWTNTLEIPAGILQPPLFNGNQVHPARNFGAIGRIMGHELTHAFDLSGREYDGNGIKRNWWSHDSSMTFQYRALCIQRQYSEFQVKGKNGTMIGYVNGELTLDENIADNGGFALAWDAYRQYMTQFQSSDVSLDEANKMFFLAYGQSSCNKATDEMLQDQLENDVHAPREWRVNGVVMNHKEFARIFNCKPQTPMNPVRKCQVW